MVGGIFFIKKERKKERKKMKIKGSKRENNQTEKSFFCFISLIAVAPKSSSLHRKIPPGCLHAPPLLTDQITSLLYLFFFLFLFFIFTCLLIKSPFFILILFYMYSSSFLLFFFVVLKHLTNI